MSLKIEAHTIDWTNSELNVLRTLRRLLSSASCDADIKRVTSALPSACRAGYLKAIKLLTKNGAVATPHVLSNACEGGHLDAAKYLVAKGASILGGSVEAAFRNEHWDVVKFLIRQDNRGIPIAARKLTEAKRSDLVNYILDNDTHLNDVKIKSHKEFVLKCMFGSPIKSVESISQDNDIHLHNLLLRFFEKTKVEPYNYLLTCPEWHQSAVIDIMNS